MDRLGRRFDDPSRRYHDNADDAEDMQNPEHPADCPCFDEIADNAEERQNPEHPADCLCANCVTRHQLRNQDRMTTLAHQLDQSLNILDRERTSASVTPQRPAGPRPSRSFPLLSPQPTRDLYLHPILGQFDTTTGSLPYQALPLGSQSRLPDIQQYAEIGAQNEHAQPGPSRPAPNRLPAIPPNHPPGYPPSPYETQERDGQNRHIPSPRPTHDQRRYSQPQRSDGVNPSLFLRRGWPNPYLIPPIMPQLEAESPGINSSYAYGSTGFPPALLQYAGVVGRNNFHMPATTSPTPNGFPPTTPHYAGSGGQNNFYVPARPSPAPTGFPPTTPHYAGPGGENNFHVPTGPPPVLQQHRGNDGQSGFAQTGYSWAVQSSVTTGVQANRGNAVTQNEEEKDDFAIDSEEE
ncbi:hypothetical protein FAVG1_06377 [Fusarium avenaceum]|nr:hypothetical protein FAVG1_06377 [Fusarium avenaceum]